ncbi:hypothetical protein CANARDRAFT_29407 [[Candida] arabinofermentans NRRL YB-2248]|uniref:Ribosomal protein L10 n=1 Tax=[Candida] arabinofermentans NRRL YB-2248 TaxID=983967 RepID=A0A1E4SXM6_9ASCO|nr:hypothetical protein CANARDRAFT_29407 [[Candida] arabinofermentans NRRL YB-2248]
MSLLLPSLLRLSVRASRSPLSKIVPGATSIAAFSTYNSIRQAQSNFVDSVSVVDDLLPSRNTVKPVASRKTYLIDIYKYFYEQNDIVLIAHHNNMLASDNEKVRKQLQAAGADFRKVKTSLFKHYLRASSHPDPASKAANRQVKRKRIRHPLEPLLRGPSSLILIKDVDPKKVKDVLNVLKQQKEKLFLVGGRVGNDMMDLTKINEFKELQTLPELQAQLAGILTMLSGAGLVQTLQSTSSVLYLNLDAHKEEMEKPTGEETK